jgi:hypothetical protein
VTNGNQNGACFIWSSRGKEQELNRTGGGTNHRIAFYWINLFHGITDPHLASNRWQEQLHMGLASQYLLKSSLQLRRWVWDDYQWNNTDSFVFNAISCYNHAEIPVSREESREKNIYTTQLPCFYQSKLPFNTS